MSHFTSLVTIATIMLLVAKYNCRCENGVQEVRKSRTQTPGLWSALGCMITDDDITKCVRDRTMHDRKDEADESNEELTASSDDDNPGLLESISAFVSDGIFRIFEDDEKDRNEETNSHNGVKDHPDDYNSHNNEAEYDDDDDDDDDDEDDDDEDNKDDEDDDDDEDEDDKDDEDDDDDDNDDDDDDDDDTENFVNTSNRTNSVAIKRKSKRSVAEDDDSRRRRRKGDKMMKLMMLGMMLKSKLSTFMMVFGALLQLKFLALSILNLVIGIVRLYIDLTKKKEPHKVVYYEQAHHQHVYDQQHEDKGWLGGWFSKKDDVIRRDIDGDPHIMAYSGQKPST